MEKKEGKNGVDSLGGGMNVEDDLRSGRRPLQVTPNPDPQLVDVGVFAIIGRDGQRVGDGQQLGAKQVFTIV